VTFTEPGRATIRYLYAHQIIRLLDAATQAA
jgi:hypothetical protein